MAITSQGARPQKKPNLPTFHLRLPAFRTVKNKFLLCKPSSLKELICYGSPSKLMQHPVTRMWDRASGDAFYHVRDRILGSAAVSLKQVKPKAYSATELCLTTAKLSPLLFYCLNSDL